MGVGCIRSLVGILPYSEFCKKCLGRADVISLIEGDLTLAQNKVGRNEPHILVCCFADKAPFYFAREYEVGGMTK